MTIRWRLSLWFTGLVTVLMTVLALWGWLSLRSALYEQARQELSVKRSEIEGVVEALASSFNEQQKKLGLQAHASHLDDVFANDQTYLYDNIFIQLTDAKQHVISRSSNLRGHSLPVQSKDVLTPEMIALQLVANHQPLQVLYAQYPLQIEQQRGHFQLGLSLLKTDTFLRQLALYECVSVMIAAILSLLMGQFLASRALSPMVEIAEQVKSMQGEDLLSLISTDNLEQDEIHLLTETFNGLLERIQTVFQTQDQFLSNAAHEFKSPLTAIQGHAQLIQKRAKSHPQILQQSTETILRESQRLSRLTDDLLLLARLEAHLPLHQEVKIKPLLLEIHQDLQPLYPRLQAPKITNSGKIIGDPDMLKRLILNLLMNALKATETNSGIVFCQLSREADKIRLTVSDQGSGIAAKHLPHLFERFYRVDSARNRKAGGTGIGLALVQEIVRCHQGQIRVISKVDQGTSFEVQFSHADAERPALT